MIIFDKHLPVPRKGPPTFIDVGHAYPLADPTLKLAKVLSSMEVGDSFLASNWAITPMNWAQKKHGFKFQRQLQPDGSVRVWRIK